MRKSGQASHVKPTPVNNRMKISNEEIFNVAVTNTPRKPSETTLNGKEGGGRVLNKWLMWKMSIY